MNNDAAHLVVQHIPRLRRYARALTGDVNRADDLVQDSLERAWSRMHLWQGEGDMRAWLFTIMHNIYVNNVRKYAREPSLVPISETDQPSNQAMATGLAEHEAQLELRDLKTAIENLPDAQREVILLVGLEQLSYQEVAAILEIPIGTVMSRLSRARERLRGMLRQEVALDSQQHQRSVK